MNYTILESWEKSSGNWVVRLQINEFLSVFLNCNGEPTQEKVNSIAEKILKDMENREENEKLYLKEVEEKNATEN